MPIGNYTMYMQMLDSGGTPIPHDYVFSYGHAKVDPRYPPPQGLYYSYEFGSALFDDLYEELTVGYTKRLSKRDVLSITQTVTPHKSQISVGVADRLLFTQQSEKAGPKVFVSSLLVFNDQVIEDHEGRIYYDKINFIQYVIIRHSPTTALTQQLGLRDYVSYLLDTDVIPSVTRRDKTTFTFPFENPVITLEVRNPDFKDGELFEFTRINRRSRGNTLQIYRDSIWPSAQRLVFTLSQLSISERNSLLDFINDSLGQYIGLLDWYGRQWKGIITTPAAELKQHKRELCNVNLQFEGTIVA